MIILQNSFKIQSHCRNTLDTKFTVLTRHAFIDYQEKFNN